MSNSYNIQVTNNTEENIIIVPNKKTTLLEIFTPQKNEVLIDAGHNSGGSYIPENLDAELEDYEQALSAQEKQIYEIQSFLDTVENQPSQLEQLLTNTLTELINDTLTTIKSYTFRQATSLQKLYLPKVTYIGTQAFHTCTGLTELSFPKLATMEAYAFQGCTKVHTVYMPLLTYLQASTFTDCISITELDLPKVTQMGNLSLSGCTNLTKLVLKAGTVCKMSNVAALNNTPIAKGVGYIYVPDNLVDSYKVATNWSTYANQIKGLSELEANS